MVAGARGRGPRAVRRKPGPRRAPRPTMTAPSKRNSRVVEEPTMGRRELELRWGHRTRLVGLAAALAFVGSACAGGEPPKPSTAEDYYNKGQQVLEGSKRLFFTNVDYPAAIAAFQEVINNFPFSEYATLA